MLAIQAQTFKLRLYCYSYLYIEYIKIININKLLEDIVMLVNPDEMFLEHQSFWFKLSAKLNIGWGKRFNYLFKNGDKHDETEQEQ